MADVDAHGLNTSVTEPEGSSSHSEQFNLSSPEICVICLDLISEKATCLPCGHDQFDFPCLGTWLQQNRSCPLCKSDIQAVRYNESQQGTRVFHLPSDELPGKSRDYSREQGRVQRRQYPSRNARNASWRDDTGLEAKDQALEFRRHVYRNRLFSLRIGSNQISQYRNITPILFARDDHLISRARKWIRRELRVFEFLNPGSTSFGMTNRRASNAEYLLEYVIEILKHIDIRGSAGQAFELLKDYLGQENAHLFLHELEAWLRSPYESLEDWDRATQYVDQPQMPNQ